MLRSLRTLVLLALFGLIWTGSLLAATPWLPFGPDGGDARRFAADPHDPAHLYLGTANGWIYESHNTGANWRRLAQVGKRDDLVLDSIIVDPNDAKHLIVGAFCVDRPDGGVFISYDGGATWISQAEMRGQSVRALAESPSDPKILVAGALRGVYRSTDGGQRWKLISPIDSTEIHEVQSVAIDPQDPSVIYAGTWHLPWKTTDAGEHWDNIKEGIIDDSDVFSILIDPANPKIVYASACSGIYKSTDAGEQFRKINGIPTTARRTRVLRQDPAHLETVFAGTTEGLFRTDDAGAKWSRTTSEDNIVNDVMVDRDNTKHILIATDRGGVLASDDGGDSFHPSNGGFSARQVIAYKKDETNPARIFVGVVNDKEWGGVFESDNGGVAWEQLSNGLQGRDVFALGQAPDGTLLAGTSHGLFRLDSASQTWARVEGAPAGTVELASTHAMPPAARPPIPVIRNQFTRQTGLSTKSSHAASHQLTVKQRSKQGTAVRPAARANASRARVTKTPLKAKAQHGPPIRSVSTPRAVKPAGPPPAAVAAVTPAPAPVKNRFFDGSVYAITSTEKTNLALTSIGLLTSEDNGVTWQLNGPPESADWRFLAAAQSNVVAASLHGMLNSTDSGAIWHPVTLPEGLTQISAVAVEPTGALWVGGREGVFVSRDGGAHWETPKNLFLSAVNSLYYDESSNRVLVTADGAPDLVFTVQLPQRAVSFTNTGWNLRFVRPVGDHLLAITLYDGVVIQPKLVPTPVTPHETASR